MLKVSSIRERNRPAAYAALSMLDDRLGASFGVWLLKHLPQTLGTQLATVAVHPSSNREAAINRIVFGEHILRFHPTRFVALGVSASGGLEVALVRSAGAHEVAILLDALRPFEPRRIKDIDASRHVRQPRSRFDGRGAPSVLSVVCLRGSAGDGGVRRSKDRRQPLDETDLICLPLACALER